MESYESDNDFVRDAHELAYKMENYLVDLASALFWLFQVDLMINLGKEMGTKVTSSLDLLAARFYFMFRELSLEMDKNLEFRYGISPLARKALMRIFHYRMRHMPSYPIDHYIVAIIGNISIELLYVETLLEYIEYRLSDDYVLRLTEMQVTIIFEKFSKKEFFHKPGARNILKRIEWERVYVKGVQIRYTRYWNRLSQLGQLNGTHGEVTNEDDMGEMEFHDVLQDVGGDLYRAHELMGSHGEETNEDDLAYSTLKEERHRLAVKTDGKELDSMIINFLDGYHGGTVRACDARMLARKDVHMYMLENDYGVIISKRKKIMSAVCRYRAEYNEVKQLKRYQYGEDKAWKAYARLVAKNKVHMQQVKKSNVRKQDFKMQLNERFKDLDVDGVLYDARECFNFGRDPAEYGFTNAQYKRAINSLQYREGKVYEEAIAQGGDDVTIAIMRMFDSKMADAWTGMQEIWQGLPTFSGLIGLISGLVRDVIGLVAAKGKFFYAYVTAMAVNWATKWPFMAKMGDSIVKVLTYATELIQRKPKTETADAQGKDSITHEYFASTMFKYFAGMIFGIYDAEITEERSLRISKSLAGVNSIGTFIRQFGVLIKEGVDYLAVKLLGFSVFGSDPKEVKETMTTTLSQMEYWMNKEIKDHREFGELQALNSRVSELHKLWVFDKESAKVAWNRCYKAFSDKYHLIAPVFNGSQVRPRPLGIIMTGKPGKGKTTYATIFATALQAMYEKRKIEDYEIVLLKRMCSGDAQDVFWEGWMNNFATLIDEFLAEKEEPSLAEILGLASNAPHPLRMAFEGKGKTFFTSRVLFLATNWETVQAGKDALGLYFPNAFARRFYRFNLLNESYDEKAMKFKEPLSLESVAKMRVEIYEHVDDGKNGIHEKLLSVSTFTEALKWAEQQLKEIDEDYMRTRNLQSLLSSPEAVEQLEKIIQNQNDDKKKNEEKIEKQSEILEMPSLIDDEEDDVAIGDVLDKMLQRQASAIVKGKIKESIIKIVEEAEAQGLSDWVQFGKNKMYQLSDRFLGVSLVRHMSNPKMRILYSETELKLLDQMASWIDSIGAYTENGIEIDVLRKFIPEGYDWQPQNRDPDDDEYVGRRIGFAHMAYCYVKNEELIKGSHDNKTLFRIAREKLRGITDWILKHWKLLVGVLSIITSVFAGIGLFFFGFTGDDDEGEAQVYSQQFERVERRRVKGKDLRPSKPGSKAVEMAKGQVLDDQVKNQGNVFRHAYARMEVVVEVDGEHMSSQGLILQICGNFWVCTRHLWEFYMVTEQYHADVTLQRGTSIVKIPVHEIKFREWEDDDGESFDLMTMEIPDKYCARGRNLIHLFVEEKELDQRIFGDVKRIAPLLDKTDTFDIYDIHGGVAYGRFRRMPTTEERSILTKTNRTNMSFETTRYLKYPHATDAGDCMTLYMINNPRSLHKAFALHIGRATTNEAVAVPVTQEMLRQFVVEHEREMAEAQCFSLGPLVDGDLDPIELDWADEHNAPVSSAIYGIIPEAHKECKSFPPQDSKIVRTELFLGEEYERAPARLKGKEVIHNVMAKANAVDVHKKTPFRETVKRNYRKAYESIILSTHLPGKLSDEETAAQPVNSEHLVAIRKDTSAGFGLKVGRKGKEGLIVATEDEVYTVAATPEFKELLQKWRERTLAGEVPVLAFCAVLKDELRTLEKVNRPRLFAAGQLILNWFAKKYFGAAYDAFLKNPLVMKHAIGQDLNGPFGQHVYRMFKENVIGYDIKNNDRTQWRERMWEFFDLIIGMSKIIDDREGISQEERFERERMRWAIAELVMSPFVVYGEVVWRDWFFNPSGNWFTSWCNTVLDQIELYENLFVLMEERGHTDLAVKEDLLSMLHDWRKMIEIPMMGFGDDTLISYGDFTYDDYVRVGKEWHGRDYQPPDKGRGNEGTAFFLSRVPRQFYSRIAWLLPEDTIRMIPFWRTKSPESNSTMSQTLCDSALAEWFYYGKEKFTEMKVLYDRELQKLCYPTTTNEFSKLLADWQSHF